MSSEINLNVFQPIVNPWYESLKNPSEAQNDVLSRLLKGYEKTGYGQTYGASSVKAIVDFKKQFPIQNYWGFMPQFEEVQKGNYAAILPEPLLCWVMTRGSTGPAKVIPTTQTHLQQILLCGARALINHVMRKKDLEIMTGKILNLNFPSNVHTTDMNGKTMTYGYSSGTYARLNPMLDKVSLLPRQEDIDAVGPGIARKDWERRFELAYQKCQGQNMVAAMGVTPVILAFARYIKHEHGKKPKDLWNFKALFCTSVRKIPYKYASTLKEYFGDAPVVEIYSATEGVFAQQLDELPYVTPNYDTYFFEVETRKEVKMLQELKRGEWGKLIVSSCLFPRYEIGDLVEAAGNNYFRVIGRNNFSTRVEHRLFRLFFGWLV
jgi:hypothetical protein